MGRLCFRPRIMVPIDEVQDALRPPRPDTTLKDFENEEPVSEMTAEDAADLGIRRGGIEPPWVIVMPQRVTRVTVAPVIEVT
jgi:hypothetical protein